jgi:Mrp family chromosome partitioning ATPase
LLFDPDTKKAAPREERRFSKSLSDQDILVSTIASAAVATVSTAVTIATATATTAVTAAATTAAVATAALFARLGFVDFDIASVNVLAVESFDRSVHRSL